MSPRSVDEDERGVEGVGSYAPARPEDVAARRRAAEPAVRDVVRVQIHRLRYTEGQFAPSVLLLQEIVLQERVLGPERDPVHSDFHIAVGRPPAPNEGARCFTDPRQPIGAGRTGILTRFRRDRIHRHHPIHPWGAVALLHEALHALFGAPRR